MLNNNELINFGGDLISLTSPIVMGIVNITPDSFYAPSCANNLQEVLDKVSKMVEDGASIIDIGAFSSKPGVELISAEEEWGRLEAVLIGLRKEFPKLIISLDTYRSEIVRKAYDTAGIQIVNDISGGEWDEQMFATVAELGLAYILMHIQGKPNSMQEAPRYVDVASEVILSLSHKLQKLNFLGVSNIIIDPGFGFGKTLAHNYSLLSRLNDFRSFDLPILVGISRKSMIYNLLDSTSNDSLNGTTALNMVALQKGAKILRVHDVKEAVECVKIYNQLSVN